MIPITDDQFLLQDTRGLAAAREVQFLTREQARTVLAGGNRESSLVQWALRQELMAVIDGRPIPLATADPELVQQFETESRPHPAGGGRYHLD